MRACSTHVVLHSTAGVARWYR